MSSTTPFKFIFGRNSKVPDDLAMPVQGQDAAAAAAAATPTVTIATTKDHGPTASKKRTADDELSPTRPKFSDRPLTFANVQLLPEQQIDPLSLPGGHHNSRPNSAFGTPLSTSVQDLHQSVFDNVPELDEEITGAWHNVMPNTPLEPITVPTTTTMAELLPPRTTTQTNGPAAAAAAAAAAPQQQQQQPPHKRARSGVTTDEEEVPQWLMPDMGTPTTLLVAPDEAARRLVAAGSDAAVHSGTSLTMRQLVSPPVPNTGIYQMHAQQQWRGSGALALVLGNSGLWLAILAFWAAMNIKEWSMIVQEEAVVEEPPPLPPSSPAPTMMETLWTIMVSLAVPVVTVAIMLAIFWALKQSSIGSPGRDETKKVVKKVTFTKTDDKDGHGNPQSPPELMVESLSTTTRGRPSKAPVRHPSPRTAAFTSMQLTVPLPGGLFLAYDDFVQLLREFTKSHGGRPAPGLSTNHANYQDMTVAELQVLARYMRIPSTTVPSKATLVRRLTTNMVATLQPYTPAQLRHILVLQGNMETAAQENKSKDELIEQIVYNGF